MYQTSNGTPLYRRGSIPLVELDISDVVETAQNPMSYRITSRTVDGRWMTSTNPVIENENKLYIEMQQRQPLYRDVEDGIYLFKMLNPYSLSMSSSYYVALTNNDLTEGAGYGKYYENSIDRISTYTSQRFLVRKTNTQQSPPSYSIQDCYSNRFLVYRNGNLRGVSNPEHTWIFRADRHGSICLQPSNSSPSVFLYYNDANYVFTLTETLRDAQALIFEKDNFIPLIRNGIYRIESVFSGKSWDSTDGKVSLQIVEESSKQKFYVNNLGGNVVTISFSPSEGNFTSVTVPIQLQLEQSNNGTIRIRNSYFDRYVSDTGSGTLSFSSDVGDNSIDEKWIFYEQIEEGIYNIQNIISSQYIQMPRHDIVQLAEYTLGAKNSDFTYFNQRFLLQKVAPGPIFTIRDMYSDMYLSASGNKICATVVPTHWKLYSSNCGLLLVSNGICFGGSLTSGVWNLTQMPSMETTGSTFVFTLLSSTQPNVLISNGVYNIKEYKALQALELKLTNENYVSEDMSCVLQNFQPSTDNQQWFIRNVENNLVTIQSIPSGKFLFSTDSAIQPSLSSIAVTNSSRNFLWYIKEGIKIQNVKTNKVILGFNSQPPSMENETNHLGEYWFFVPTTVFQYLQPDNGVYIIKKISENKYLELQNNLLALNSLYWFNTKNELSTQCRCNQRFEFQRVQNPNTIIPYYTIRDCYAFDQYVSSYNGDVVLSTQPTFWKMRRLASGDIDLLPLSPGSMVNFTNISLSELALEQDSSIISIPDNVYYIQNSLLSGSLQSTASVTYVSYQNEQDKELFRVRNLGDNVVTIQNIADNKFIALNRPATTQLWSYSVSRLWINITTGAQPGTFEILDNTKTYNLRLYDSGSNFSLQVVMSNIGSNWLFLQPVDISGTFYIKNLNSSMYVELENNLIESNSPYIVNSRNISMTTRAFRNQRFSIEKVQAGGYSYRIRDCYTDLYLTMDTSSNPFKVRSTDISTNEWKILKTLDNNIVLIFKSIAKPVVLDVVSQVLSGVQSGMVSSSQYMTLEQTNFVPVVPNGVYRFRSEIGTKTAYIGVENASTGVGPDGDIYMLLLPGSSTKHIEWKVRNLEDDIITLQNMNIAADTGLPTFMYVTTDDGRARQHWWSEAVRVDVEFPSRWWFKILPPNASGRYRVSNMRSGRVFMHKGDNFINMEFNPQVQVKQNTLSEEFYIDKIQ